MNIEYEQKLRQNMVIDAQMKQAGFPGKSYEQIEQDTNRELHEVNIYECSCGTEYGEHEKDKMIECTYCGKTICSDCSGDHGKDKFNREKYGMCARK